MGKCKIGCVPIFPGAALVHEGRVLHLSAFGQNSPGDTRDRVPLQPFSLGDHGPPLRLLLAGHKSLVISCIS